MSAQAIPLFELHLGPEKVRLAPTSADELADWTDKEYGAWEKVHSAPMPPDGGFLGNVQGVLKNLGRARTHAAAAKTQQGQQMVDSINAVKSHIDDVFNRHNMVLSDSLKGRLVRELAADDPYAAKVALYFLGVGGISGNAASIQHPSTGRGLVQGALIHRLSGAGLSESALQELIRKGEQHIVSWTAKHEQALERVDKTHREEEASLEQFRRDIAAAKEDHGVLLRDMKATFDAELKTAKESLEKFREAVTRDIALKQPTEYWRSKATGHRRNGVLLFLALAALMAVFGFAANEIFPTLVTETADGKRVPSYGNIAGIVVMATLAFWVLRIVVRLFFSQAHLSQDAQERVTMVITYLALLETGKFQPGDLATVLNALFRNAADGIVKDEGMPPSLWEIVTRQNR